MVNSFLNHASSDFYPEVEDKVMDSIFKQYERVIVESLITSFGLDFIINDKYGGDVDTIHNVRKIGHDEEMSYKNNLNSYNYENRGNYNSSEYHGDKGYIEKNRQVKLDKLNGNLYDAYTSKKISINEKSDLDHTIAAKEIHEDRGRVLAGLRGVDLANSSENLNITNPHTNRTKKADSMDIFIDKYGENYTDKQKEAMKQKDNIARKSYETKIATAYYTSPQFAKDVAYSSGVVGARMGVRQALGFVFAEIWFAIKDEFKKLGKEFDLAKMLIAIGEGIKTGFENAKKKHKELLSKLKDGAVAGALASLTTTLSNIFFTTAKNVVKVIRQSYVSIVEACKVLFINPSNLEFGDMLKEVVKILSVGASVVAGSFAIEAIGKTPLVAMPVIGEVVQGFCGAFVTGILSCTFLYFLDRNENINKLVNSLNSVRTIDSDISRLKRQTEYFEKYSAELMKIDFVKLKEESDILCKIINNLSSVGDERELNTLLRKTIELTGGELPWEGSFDDFMKDSSKGLIFK